MLHSLYGSYVKRNGLVRAGVKGVKPFLKPLLPPAHYLGVKKNTLDDSFTSLIRNKAIALVGNSPILDGSGKGEEIDSADIVIRMNGGVIQSKLNQADTGLKTDIWSSGAMHSISDPEVRRAITDIGTKLKGIILALGDRSSGVDPLSKLYVLCKFCLQDNVYYLPHEFLNSIISYLDNYSPSTGMRTFMTLLSQGDFSKLDLYGFSFNTDHRIYGEDRSGNLPITHDFNLEKQRILEAASEDSRIKVHT